MKIIAAFLILLLPICGYCDTQVNTYTNEQQVNADCAVNSSGNSVIAWQSFGQDGDGLGVYAQRFNSNFDKVGAEFRVNTTTVSNQQNPCVGIGDSGNFIVAWESEGDREINIYARIYNSDGSTKVAQFLVSEAGSGNNYNPSVSMSKTGEFVITWQNGEDNVLARFYNSNGNTLAPPTIVNSVDATLTCGNPDVAIDSNNISVIVWRQENTSQQSTAIMARQYNGSGISNGPAFLVNPNDAYFLTYSIPSVAANSSGRFAIAWNDNQNNNSEFDNIYAKVYEANLAVITGKFMVNQNSNGTQQNASITMNSNGKILIAWEDDANLPSNETNIVCQQFNLNGSRIGSELRLNDYTQDSQSLPCISMNNSGTIIAAWQSLGQDGSNWGIFGKKVVITAEVSTDFSGDCFTNFKDFAMLAEEWLKSGSVQTDLTGDGAVNNLDLNIFSQKWLQYCIPCIDVNLENDGIINFADYAIMSKNWLKTGSSLVGDVNNDDIVDYDDLSAIAYYWLGNCQ